MVNDLDSEKRKVAQRIERGSIFVIVITLVILADPVLAAGIWEWRALMQGSIGVTLFHGVAAAVMIWLLRSPMIPMHWIASAILIANGVVCLVRFLVSQGWWGAYVSGYYGILCILAALNLIFSPSTKAYLEARRSRGRYVK